MAGVMARRKAVRDGGLSPDTDVPFWQQRSIERSLQDARLREQERRHMLVTAALALIVERETGDFTIEEVGERAGMSLRTFYAFFDSRDSLMLAIYDTIMSKSAVPVLTERLGDAARSVLWL